MAFARVGYSLEQAIADLIDNSIDADASVVLVRFLYDRKSVHRCRRPSCAGVHYAIRHRSTEWLDVPPVAQDENCGERGEQGYEYTVFGLMSSYKNTGDCRIAERG